MDVCTCVGFKAAEVVDPANTRLTVSPAAAPYQESEPTD
jgi:hypothetical protein